MNSDYDSLSQIAFAYMRQGNDQRFEDAMTLIDRHFENMQSQGIDNFAFSASVALHYAMRGDIDSAFDNLSSAIDRGWATAGEPTVVEPRLTLMSDDPRFELARATMLMTLNRDREIVGLPPFGDYSQVIADVQ